MNFNDDEIVGLLNRLLEMLHQQTVTMKAA